MDYRDQSAPKIYPHPAYRTAQVQSMGIAQVFMGLSEKVPLVAFKSSDKAIAKACSMSEKTVICLHGEEIKPKVRFV